MKTYTETEIIEVLRRRVGYGRTQAQLAGELGIKRPHLCAILSGKRRITKSLILALGFVKCEDRYTKAVK